MAKMLRTSRKFSTWIADYASLPATARLASLQKDVLPKYVCQQDPQKMIMQDLSRTRFAMKTAFAVRADISSLVSSVPSEQVKALKVLDLAVQDWLVQALSLDSLQHKRITFDHSSGLTLEKVARGESVHRVRSLSELKRRLHDGKRCFAFFHPSLAAEPLVFVHVGLTTELSASLSSLDSSKDEQRPTHAIFYSINSPHTALRGLDIASLLIKETAAALREAFPSLHTFSTLSPIPKLCTWLSKGSNTVDSELLRQLHAVGVKHRPDLFGSLDASNGPAVMRALSILFTNESLDWVTNKDFCEELRLPMLQLGAHYIANERRSTSEGLVPLDDVARFHLRNGAVFHAINWMGNPSKNGLTNSAGMMVNYLYDPERLDDNAARFGGTQWEVPTGVSARKALNRV